MGTGTGSSGASSGNNPGSGGMSTPGGGASNNSGGAGAAAGASASAAGKGPSAPANTGASKDAAAAREAASKTSPAGNMGSGANTSAGAAAAAARASADAAAKASAVGLGGNQNTSPSKSTSAPNAAAAAAAAAANAAGLAKAAAARAPGNTTAMAGGPLGLGKAGMGAPVGASDTAAQAAKATAAGLTANKPSKSATAPASRATPSTAGPGIGLAASAASVTDPGVAGVPGGMIGRQGLSDSFGVTPGTAASIQGQSFTGDKRDAAMATMAQAKAMGLNPSTGLALVAKESSFNPRAVNKSSHIGLGQFQDQKTFDEGWKAARQQNPSMPATSPGYKSASVMDQAAAALAYAGFAAPKMAGISNPTGIQGYMSHQMGPGNFKSMTANPDKTMAQLGLTKEANANPFGMTNPSQKTASAFQSGAAANLAKNAADFGIDTNMSTKFRSATTPAAATAASPASAATTPTGLTNLYGEGAVSPQVARMAAVSAYVGKPSTGFNPAAHIRAPGMNKPSPPGTPVDNSVPRATVTAPGTNLKTSVNAKYGANFQGLLNDMAADPRTKFTSVGGFAPRDRPTDVHPSYHMKGEAMDVNQYDRNKIAGMPPRSVTDAMAYKAGLTPGSTFGDIGHYEARNPEALARAQRAMVAGNIVGENMAAPGAYPPGVSRLGPSTAAPAARAAASGIGLPSIAGVRADAQGIPGMGTAQTISGANINNLSGPSPAAPPGTGPAIAGMVSNLMSPGPHPSLGQAPSFAPTMTHTLGGWQTAPESDITNPHVLQQAAAPNLLSPGPHPSLGQAPSTAPTMTHTLGGWQTAPETDITNPQVMQMQGIHPPNPTVGAPQPSAPATPFPRGDIFGPATTPAAAPTAPAQMVDAERPKTGLVTGQYGLDQAISTTKMSALVDKFGMGYSGWKKTMAEAAGQIPSFVKSVSQNKMGGWHITMKDGTIMDTNPETGSYSFSAGPRKNTTSFQSPDWSGVEPGVATAVAAATPPAPSRPTPSAPAPMRGAGPIAGTGTMPSAPSPPAPAAPVHTAPATPFPRGDVFGPATAAPPAPAAPGLSVLHPPNPAVGTSTPPAPAPPGNSAPMPGMGMPPGGMTPPATQAPRVASSPSPPSPGPSPGMASAAPPNGMGVNTGGMMPPTPASFPMSSAQAPMSAPSSSGSAPIDPAIARSLLTGMGLNISGLSDAAVQIVFQKVLSGEVKLPGTTPTTPTPTGTPAA